MSACARGDRPDDTAPRRSRPWRPISRLGACRAHNEAVGIANDALGGYHETLTRLWIHAIALHHAAHSRASLADSFALLLHSPLAGSHPTALPWSGERPQGAVAALAVRNA